MLLFFRRSDVLAITSAAVLSFTAADVALKLNPVESAGPNLLVFRTRTGRFAVEPATITLSAGDVALSQAPATITIDSAALTLSTDTIAFREVLAPDTAVLTLSAADVALVAAPLTVVVPDPGVLALSAADVGLAIDLRQVRVFLQGVERTALCQIDAQSLETEINDHPDTVAFVLTGGVVTPTVGMEVTMAQGSTSHLIFGGTVQQVEHLFPTGRRTRVDYRLTCIDYGYTLSRRVVFARYQQQSATAIAQALTSLVSGFSAAGVEAGLPVIDDLELTGVSVHEALATVAQRVGGHYYVAPTKTVHLFLAESADAPDPLTNAAPGRDLQITTDLSQVRTRVYVTGRGSAAAAPVSAGMTTLPVAEVDPFEPSGTVRVGDQVVPYTSVVAGAAAGSTVVGTSVTPSAPMAAATTVSGPITGAPRYAVSYVLDLRDGSGAELQVGETPVSALSAPVSIPVVNPPVAGALHVQHGLANAGVTLFREGTRATLQGLTPFSLLPGARVQIKQTWQGSFDGLWTVVALDAIGQPIISGVSTVAPSGSFGTCTTITAGPLEGSVVYRLTYESALGETLGGTTFGVSVSGVQTNLLAFTSTTPGSSGALTPNTTYTYWIGVLTERGESALIRMGAVSLGGGQTSVALTWPPHGSDTRVTGLRLYRDRPGDPLPRAVVTLAATATAYEDKTADAALSDLPLIEPVGAAIGLASLPVPSDPRALRKHLYRSVNGSAFLRIGTLDRAQTWFFDAVPLADAQAQPPTESRFGGVEVDVTVPIGPTGTVRRRVWRETAAGVMLVGSIGDNTTTAPFRDRRADHELDELAPTTSRVSVPAGATTIPVQSSASFPANGGWAVVDGQLIAYASITTGALLGVPSSGAGRLQRAIRAGATVSVHPHLRLSGGLARGVDQGTPVRVFVQVDDASAQAALAADEGSDGIREHALEHSEWSAAACRAAGEADLALHGRPRITITFKRRDRKLAVGKSISVSLGAPINVSGTFVITAVSVDDLGQFPSLYPERRVTAENGPPLTFDAYLRRLLPQVA